MLIRINKQDIDLLTCTDLSKKCFEPLIKHYKREVASQDDFTKYREQFYNQLTEGQRSLFMFYVYYNHVSKSLKEFYWWSAYFMAQPITWAALKASLRYFKDENMLLLLEKIEQELKQHNHPHSLESFTVTREHLDQNEELKKSIKSLHEIFEHTSPLSIKRLNDYTEKNLQEFIEI